MPQACTCCTSEHRRAIDRALVDSSRVNTRIAARFGVQESAVRYHAEHHLPARLVKAHAAAEVAEADDLLGQLVAIKDRAEAIADRAEAAGNLTAALGGLREMRGCVELLAELRHELDRRPVVNVLVLPQWIEARSALLEALAPYPDARVAVAERLLALEHPA
jgi:hypothetical protein